MPRPYRMKFEGAFYHLYNRGANKSSIFFDDIDRKVFLRMISALTEKYKVRVYSYCLMDNHYHFFVQTDLPNLDRYMQHFQGQYAQFVNLKYARSGCLFQGRFQSKLIESEAYGLEIIRYIHLNPVEACLVQNPEDYQWSSYAVYLGKISHRDWFNTKWVLSQFSNSQTDGLAMFKVFHKSGTRGV